jgi:hypothetical protein
LADLAPLVRTGVLEFLGRPQPRACLDPARGAQGARRTWSGTRPADRACRRVSCCTSGSGGEGTRARCAGCTRALPCTARSGCGGGRPGGAAPRGVRGGRRATPDWRVSGRAPRRRWPVRRRVRRRTSSSASRSSVSHSPWLILRAPSTAATASMTCAAREPRRSSALTSGCCCGRGTAVSAAVVTVSAFGTAIFFYDRRRDR